MKIALVHDYFKEWGGAEEVVKVLHEVWPDAPLYTSFVADNAFDFVGKDSDTTKEQERGEAALSSVRLITSWLNKLPNRIKASKFIVPFLPFAFQSFRFKDFDVVVSSTSSFAKSLDIKKPSVHICYCHTPPRFLYGLQREHVANGVSQIVEIPLNWCLKFIDQEAAKRVDYFIANSYVVADRIEKFYRRESTVIYPPVDVDKFLLPSPTPLPVEKTDGYFVTIGRLSPVKHFEVAIEACKKLNLPLKIIGSGPDEKRLRSIAGSTVEFLGRLSNEETAHYVAQCRALINPVLDEDFGIVPLEVLGAGKPVIAFAADAAKETLENGVTGKLFYQPTAESLAEVLADFDETQYSSEMLRRHAKKFSEERFAVEVKDFVESHTTRLSS